MSIVKELFRYKKVRILLLLCGIVVIFGIIIAFIFRGVFIKKYESAINYYNNLEYEKAKSIFIELGDYQNSKEYLELIEKDIKEKEEKEKKELLARLSEEELKTKYAEAMVFFEGEDYENAIKVLESIGDYLDSKDKLDEAKLKLQIKNNYEEAVKLYNEEEYEDALGYFEALGNYMNSIEYATNCRNYIKRNSLSHTISAGIRYTAIIDKENKLSYSGESMKIKNEIEAWEDVVSVSAYGEYVLGLLKNGDVKVSNASSAFYRIDVSVWSDIIDICSGELFVVGLKKDGTLTAQGHNGDGQIDIDEWNNIIDIDAGWRHTVGLTDSGEVYIVGHGATRQLRQIDYNKSEWNDIVAVSAGGGQMDDDYGYTIGLRKDGHVVAVGDNRFGRCDVENWDSIKSVSAGDHYTVGLKNDGTVICSSQDEEIIQQITNWKNIIEISSGYNYIIAKDEDGNLFFAGRNKDGIRDYIEENGVLTID